MRTFLLALLLAVLVSVAFAARNNRRRSRNNVQNDEVPDDVEEGGEDVEEEEVDVAAAEGRPKQDPCKRKKCYRGEVCHLTTEWKAECQCLDKCEKESNPRYHVCSTKNITYDSECALDRDHCLCKHKLPGCTQSRLNKIQLDFFGDCRELTPCPDGEFSEFPYRMKEWLFIIMKDLAARNELGAYIDLLDRSRNDANHTEAVIWKFCDLDSSPQDRQVSRRELQYIVQSLKPWEHCLVPFLAKCDKDNNRKITLKEWGACLGIDEKKIVDKCIDIRTRAKRL